MELIYYVNKNSSIWKNVQYETRTASIFGFPFEINPHEFISYANYDLDLYGKRGLVSALKNAKVL